MTKGSSPCYYTLSIQLDNTEPYLSAGKQLRGTVTVISRNPNYHNRDLKVKLTVEGKCKVNFTYREPLADTTGVTDFKDPFQLKPVPVPSSKKCTAEENYKSETQVVILGPNYAERKTFRFALTLPSNLPSSFTHSLGTISYLLKGQLVSASDTVYAHVDIPITVSGSLNLNSYNGAKNSHCSREGMKNGGRVHLHIRLPKSGYVPGELLNFSCDIINNSGEKHVESVTANFMQILTFSAEGMQETDQRTILCATCPSVSSGNVVGWTTTGFCVPPLIHPTKLGGGCSLIDVQYQLQIKANITGRFRNSLIYKELPIVIGTVPLE